MTDLADIPPEKRKIGPLVWASLIAPILVVVVLLIYEIIAPVHVSVANHSEKPLTGITVSIQHHELAFPDLAPGQVHRLWFRNQRITGHYTLTAQLGADKEIEETQGELRSGMLHGFYGPAVFTIEKDESITFSGN